MLPHSHFIAFNDIKSKHFSNELRDSSVYNISCIRQSVAQESDKIHVFYARKFCRPTLGVGVLSKGLQCTVRGPNQAREAISSGRKNILSVLKNNI